MRTTTLVTYNIRTSTFNEADHSDNLNNWQYRKHAVFDLVKKQNPDIICFQEDSQEQLKDLAEFFGNDYEVVYSPEAFVADNQEYNSIFVRKEFKVIDKKYFFISETPDVPSRVPGSLYTRHFTSVALEIDGQRHLVINHHLDNLQDYVFKTKEAELFLDIFDKNFSQERNVVMAGDFNLYADDNDAYKAFAKRFVDVSKVMDVRAPTHTNWLMWNTYLQIDYCWILPGSLITPRSFEIVRDKYRRTDGRMMEPSDHFLIRCELEISG